MTQREFIQDDTPRARVYDTGADAGTSRTTMVANSPTDLVRWGPIIAGIFTALATLAALTVLGLAIGLESVDANDTPSGFGIGAGIWGALSTLLAFLAGGFIAARTAAFGGRTSGIMNGAMVWIVGIPLIIYLLGSGITGGLRSVLGLAGNAATAAAPLAGQAGGALANDPAAQAQAGGAIDALQATATAAQANVTPQDVANVAETAGNTAWAVLLSLGLGAAAAIGGGYLGGKTVQKDHEHAVSG